MAWWSVSLCGWYKLDPSASGELSRFFFREVLTVQDKMVEMQNGCICCTLRDDLIEHVTHLAEEKRFDYLLIETETKLAVENWTIILNKYILVHLDFHPLKACDDSRLTFIEFLCYPFPDLHLLSTFVVQVEVSKEMGVPKTNHPAWDHDLV